MRAIAEGVEIVFRGHASTIMIRRLKVGKGKGKSTRGKVVKAVIKVAGEGSRLVVRQCGNAVMRQCGDTAIQSFFLFLAGLESKLGVNPRQVHLSWPWRPDK